MNVESIIVSSDQSINNNVTGDVSMKKKREKRIDEIARIAMRIKQAVSTDYHVKRDTEELRLLEEQGFKKWKEVSLLIS